MMILIIIYEILIWDYNSRRHYNSYNGYSDVSPELSPASLNILRLNIIESLALKSIKVQNLKNKKLDLWRWFRHKIIFPTLVWSCFPPFFSSRWNFQQFLLNLTFWCNMLLFHPREEEKSHISHIKTKN